MLLRSVSWAGTVSLGVIVTYIVLAIFAPVLAPHGEAEVVGGAWISPDMQHWLGTDGLGRDMLSRVMYGGRRTMSIALAVTVAAFLLGTLLGLSAAIGRSWLDTVLSRTVDGIMALPSLIVALLVLSVLGSSIPGLIGVLAVLDATRFFRLSRAIGQDIMSRDYVEVARLRGESIRWLITREVLPNATSVLATEFAIRFCAAVLQVSALAFLGLGVQPPSADWGSMVNENAIAINFGIAAPLFPAAAIAGVTVSLNVLVTALSDTSRFARV
ncbi:MAG: ABC transporter permease [Alphaproteobacteria bacterium]|nr:ABC transporter permease [Alphaproteobacteria bacterium]